MESKSTAVAAAVGVNGESSLRDILNVLFRHKKKIVLFFIVVVALITAVTYLAQEVYQSEAKLLVRVGRESVATDPTVVGPTMGVWQTRENEVNTEILILSSQDLAESVVDEFGPDAFLRAPDEEAGQTAVSETVRGARRAIRDKQDATAEMLQKLDLASAMPDREKAVKKFMKSLKIEVLGKSHIIGVQFDAADPYVAQNALNSLIGYYLKRHIEVFSGLAPSGGRSRATEGQSGSGAFLQQQREAFLDDLEGKERDLDQFRKDHAIATMEAQKDALIGQVRDLQAGLDDADGQIGSAGALIKSLEASLSNHDAEVQLSRVTGKTNYAADVMKGEMFSLQVEQMRLASQFDSDFRRVKDAEERVSLAKEVVDREMLSTPEEITTGINNTRQALDLALETARGDLRAQEARQGALAKALGERRGELQELAENEIALKSLERQVEVADAMYRQMSDNVARAEVSEELDRADITNVRLVQDPTLPRAPIRPRKMLNIIIGILLGAFGGVLFAFFMEYIDDSIRTNEDVKKRLDLPVLASIPLRRV
jgi:uncharacterized protein involved in exopolysaccharide biosynthesis